MKNDEVSLRDSSLHLRKPELARAGQAIPVQSQVSRTEEAIVRGCGFSQSLLGPNHVCPLLSGTQLHLVI